MTPTSSLLTRPLTIQEIDAMYEGVRVAREWALPYPDDELEDERKPQLCQGFLDHVVPDDFLQRHTCSIRTTPWVSCRLRYGLTLREQPSELTAMLPASEQVIPGSTTAATAAPPSQPYAPLASSSRRLTTESPPPRSLMPTPSPNIGSPEASSRGMSSKTSVSCTQRRSKRVRSIGVPARASDSPKGLPSKVLMSVTCEQGLKAAQELAKKGICSEAFGYLSTLHPQAQAELQQRTGTRGRSKDCITN